MLPWTRQDLVVPQYVAGGVNMDGLGPGVAFVFWKRLKQKHIPFLSEGSGVGCTPFWVYPSIELYKYITSVLYGTTRLRLFCAIWVQWNCRQCCRDVTSGMDYLSRESADRNRTNHQQGTPRPEAYGARHFTSVLSCFAFRPQSLGGSDGLELRAKEEI